MPPSSRRRTRKEADPITSDAPDPETVNTPTRKRRKVDVRNSYRRASLSLLNPSQLNGSASKPAQSKSTHARTGSESDATIDNANEPTEPENTPLSIAEECIRRLKVANYRVQASIEYNNDIVDTAREAYAKIAGKEWTFYVVDTKVVLGRPVKPKRESSGVPDSQEPKGENHVDIDLGPDQLISRNHAQIDYDADSEQWVMTVNGRNGVLVDEHRCEKGSRIALRSGMVFAILGTQMMFLLPQQAPEVSPEIRRQLLSDPAEVTEEEADGELPSASRIRGDHYLAGQPSSASRPLTMTASQAVQQAASGLQSLSNPGTPLSRSQPGQPKSKQSPVYARGLMMESNEEIDYSLAGNKDIKPPYSYAQMIGQAILSKPEENATLAQIYDFIKERYSYFRTSGTGWQNSIRHNLSLSKSFEKIPRRTDEPGKGMKWRIVEDQKDDFVKKTMQSLRPGALKGSSSTGRMGSSGPNSPAGTVVSAAAQTERLLGALSGGENSQPKRSSRSVTPPLVAYPTAMESFTPDRGPSAVSHGRIPMTTGLPMVTPGRPPVLSQTSIGPPPRMGLNDGAMHSPPTLYDSSHGNNLFTPLVARSKALMPHPSTVKLPSFYAKELFSSPAPFWKYVDMGSTPARPPIGFDLSPEKSDAEEDGDEADDDEVDSAIERQDSAAQAGAEVDQPTETDVKITTASRQIPIANPSSPPSSGNEGEEPLDASPTRTLSRPASRRVTETLPAKPAAHLIGSLKQSMETMPRFTPSGSVPAPAPTSAAGAAQLTNGARLGSVSTGFANSLGGPTTTASGNVFGVAANGLTSVGAPALGGPARMPDLGPALNPYALPEVDEDEEEEIDLAK